jgi:hypothetical protein
MVQTVTFSTTEIALGFIISSGSAAINPKIIAARTPTIIITEVTVLENDLVEVKGTTEADAEVTVTFPTGEQVTVIANENGSYVAITKTPQPTDGSVNAVATE